ncbi:MAG: hypothetical protein Ct9H300mP16_01340 [Pseudomonadota bacterium]|nr:MAG: hypothetical protein Ct9H300mP16_01340 [Pseudomonadota bacterium]
MDHTPIDPEWLMMTISETLPENTIVVDEGLTAAKTLLDFLPLRDRHSYFGMVSGGIGWGIAAAVGIGLAQPDRRIAAIIGDGSALYSPQALWTAAHLALPITFIILNNGWLSDSQKSDSMLFMAMTAISAWTSKRRPSIWRALPSLSVCPESRSANPGRFAASLTEALERPGPALLEVMVEPGPG